MSVVQRVCDDEDVTRDLATRAFDGMLQYLDLAANSDGPFPPSHGIDAAWHAFILHTRSYAGYCEERFGRFLHHQPSTELADADRPDPETEGTPQYLAARDRAQERYGSLDPLIWPTASPAE